nr:ATP-dependent helicase, C-terminal [Tanacetum cinerariifolium]
MNVEESKSWFTETKNSKVTKINSNGSNGVAASQVATRINKCALPTKKCSSPPSMNISHDDCELTVAETPNHNEPLTVKKEPINEAYSTTVESVSEVDFSHSTIIQTNFPHSFTSPCSASASAFNTPKKQYISHNRSPLYSSVNSHVHKRRKSSPPVTVKMDQNPLGLVENNYFVSCSVTSLSMVHLATIWKGIATGPTSVPVLEVSPSSVTSVSKSPVQNPFEKFAYVPPETNSLGWRTTKSKMRLPKRVHVSTAKH